MGFLFVCKHLNSLLTEWERKSHLIFLLLFLFGRLLVYASYLVRDLNLCVVRHSDVAVALGRKGAIVMYESGWICQWFLIRPLILHSHDNHRFHVFILNNGKRKESKALPKFYLYLYHSRTHLGRSTAARFFSLLIRYLFSSCLHRTKQKIKAWLYISHQYHLRNQDNHIIKSSGKAKHTLYSITILLVSHSTQSLQINWFFFLRFFFWWHHEYA